MAYLDDIEAQYKKMKLAKDAEFLQKKNQDLADLSNQETGTVNQFADLVNGYKAKQGQAKEGFYQDRNDVALNHAQNVQRLRDYMAKNNLMSSGENVDAMLRANTDLGNRLGEVYGQEKQSDNYYAGQVDSAEREKAQKISDIMNKIRLVNDNYSSGLQAAQDRLDAEKLGDISKYNLMKEEEAAKERTASLRTSSPRTLSSRSYSTTKEPNILKETQAEFNRQFTDGNAEQWLDDNKAELIQYVGAEEYKKMFDKVINNKVKLSQNKSHSMYRVGAGAAGRQLMPE